MVKNNRPRALKDYSQGTRSKNLNSCYPI